MATATSLSTQNPRHGRQKHDACRRPDCRPDRSEAPSRAASKVPRRCQPGALPERVRPGQAEPPLFRGRQPRGLQLVEVLARVHECQRLDVDRLGLENVGGHEHALGQELILEQGIFADRKGMTGRQRHLIARMITALIGRVCSSGEFVQARQGVAGSAIAARVISGAASRQRTLGAAPSHGTAMALSGRSSGIVPRGCAAAVPRSPRSR